MGETCIYVHMFIYVAIIVFAVIAVERDDKKLICSGPLRYYKDLGCTPIYSTGPCATRYNCDHVKERFKTSCYINGHEYKPGHWLREEDKNSCDGICNCLKGNENQIAAFGCYSSLILSQPSLCPKSFAPRGCYFRYDPSKCCNNSVAICPEEAHERDFCIVDGKEYLDGDRFYVKEDPDLHCVCLPGYEGKNVWPFCIKSNHSNCAHPAFDHTDYFGQKCAPIFINRQLEPNGCYVKMRCQHPNDRVIHYYNMKRDLRSDEEHVCLFGNLKIQIGDVLEPFKNNTVNCILCMCEVPPVLTCEYLTANRLCNI